MGKLVILNRRSISKLKYQLVKKVSTVEPDVLRGKMWPHHVWQAVSSVEGIQVLIHVVGHVAPQ